MIMKFENKDILFLSELAICKDFVVLVLKIQ